MSVHERAARAIIEADMPARDRAEGQAMNTLSGRARTVCHAMESALRCAEAARAPTDVVACALAAVRELEHALEAARVDDDVIGRAGRAYDALERWRVEQAGAIPGYYLG